MILKELHLSNFRNYQNRHFHFDSRGAFLHGKNGAGKTNVLEAVYMLAFAKSFRAGRNSDMLTWNTRQATITGIYMDSNGLDNEIELKFNKKKRAAT